MYRVSDVTIAGGSIYGCLAAVSAARAGAEVALIEPGTFLGHEFTSSLRPWVNSMGYENLNDELKSLFFDGGNCTSSNDTSGKEIPLSIGQIKKNLLKGLLENGVTVLFMSEIVGVITKDNNTAGVLIGTKNGLKMFWTKAIVDATENKRTAMFGGAKVKVRSGNINVRRTIEYLNVSDTGRAKISVPEGLGIRGSAIELHLGKKQKGQCFVDFALSFDIHDGTFSEHMGMEMEARLKALTLAEHLRKEESAFKDAFLAQTSTRLYIPGIYDIEDGVEIETGIIEINGCRNLLTFKGNAYLSHDPDCNELMQAFDISKRIGEKAAFFSYNQESPAMQEDYRLSIGKGKYQFNTSLLREDSCEKLGVTLFSVDLSEIHGIPAAGSFDIVVAGGGTSGAPAAIASASMGARAALIENFWGLGGTKTLGGVKNYYHGCRGGFTRSIDEQTASIAERITSSADYTHIESKMTAYLTEMKNHNISVYLGTKAVGTVMSGNAVKGILIANSGGLGLVSTGIAIDATGDGDAAALAGAIYSYGSPRDGVVQTFNHNGYTKRTFVDLGIIDTRSMTDTVRGICIGHEMGDSYDFHPLLTVRESRRIEGDYELNIADVLMDAGFDDVISIAMTDWDPHGVNDSWVGRLGYLALRAAGDKKVSIPYRICLPKGIEGLLIAAKAVSATRDAFNFIRMSADMQNLGYAVGTAAALAWKQGVTPRNVNVAELQDKLLKYGIIPEEALHQGNYKHPSGRRLVSELAGGSEEAFFKVLFCKKDEVQGLLEEAYDECSTKLQVAKALAWFGSNTGAEVLLQELERLYKRENHKFHMDLNPLTVDGTPLAGFIDSDDIYWKINQLIVLLGLAGDKKALSMICEIASSTESGGPPYIVAPPYMCGSLRIDWVRVPHYDRVLCLCFALERLADRSAVPALESLLDKPYLHGFVSKKDLYAGGNLMSIYLEVVIARALARCGGAKGALVLADYMDDVQYIFSNHAYSELKDITGQDLGRDSSSWKRWIQEQEELPVRPFTGEYYEYLQ